MLTKEISEIRGLVKPARRHKCDICRNIFECHLCDSRYTHPLHIELRRDTDFVYVCMICAIKKNMNFVTTISAYTRNRDSTLKQKVNLARTYDYYTGRLLEKDRIHGRVDNFQCWSS